MKTEMTSTQAMTLYSTSEALCNQFDRDNEKSPKPNWEKIAKERAEIVVEIKMQMFDVHSKHTKLLKAAKAYHANSAAMAAHMDEWHTLKSVIESEQAANDGTMPRR